MSSQDALSGTLIIGAGIAGLWTALSLAPRPVTVITAGELGAGSSSWAQGGLAAALGADDGAEAHAADTIIAGVGLCDEEAVRVLTDGAVEAVEALSALGVPFDRGTDGALILGREAAHRADRIVHVGGDEAGASIMRVLTDAARKADHINIHERHVAERVLTRARRVCGAMVWDRVKQRSKTIRAGTIVLATGGLGGLYGVTTNPLSAQGHGLALAAEAGATLRDLEFVQFHPTGLDVGRDPAPLATEAIRGEGAHLIDADGERFMTDIHPLAELAPRDVVARGVALAIGRTGKAFLDVRDTIGAAFGDRFPTVAAACAEAGIDPLREPIPIAPAAHYHMGGIRTDIDGRTDVDGLYAVGECASTGVHGANRLASNSLLEAIVFGSRIAADLTNAASLIPTDPPFREETLPHAPATDLAPLRRRLAAAAGMVRNAEDLCDALAFLDGYPIQSVGDRLALRTARLVVTAALAREESRGAHQRGDHPDQDETPRHSLIVAGNSHVMWEDEAS